MANENMEKWNYEKVVAALGDDLEERTRISEREIWMLATERGNLEALEEFSKLARGEITRSEMKTQLQCQSDKNLQIRISLDGKGRVEVFGFGALSNVAASGSPALLTPEADEMRKLSYGGEHAKKKGLFSRIFNQLK